MNNEKYTFRKFVSNWAIAFILIGLMVIFTVLSSNFFTASNLFTILRQSCMAAILCAGVSMLLITGNFDLSVASNIAFVGIVVAILIKNFGMSIPLAAVIGILVSIGIGFINGFIVTKFKVMALIVTLATQQVFLGFAYLMTDGIPIFGVDEYSVLASGAVPVIIMIIVLVVVSILLTRTYYGRYLFAIGSNKEAAELSGVNTNKIQLITFMVCGGLAGLTALIMLGRVTAAQPTAGTGFEMDCITAAVLGGVSVSGGKGNVWGALIGVLIINVIGNGLTISGFNEYMQLVIKGCILVAAVIIDSIQSQTALRAGKKEIEMLVDTEKKKLADEKSNASC